MDGPGFEALTRLCGAASSRRALVAVLGSLLTGPWQSGAPVSAKKKPKKITVCDDGLTIRVPKTKKKRLLKHGATSGACPRCTTCPEGELCTSFDHVCCPSDRVTTDDLGTAHASTACCPEGYLGDIGGNPGCCEGPNSGFCPSFIRAR